MATHYHVVSTNAALSGLNYMKFATVKVAEREARGEEAFGGGTEIRSCSGNCEEVLSRPGNSSSQRLPSSDDTASVSETSVPETGGNMARNKATATATAKPDPKPKADKAKKATTPTDATATDRRERGGLEALVIDVCNDYCTGKIKVDDAALTPHRIAAEIARKNSLDKPPSTGAVSATLDRWADIGFAEIAPKPKAFVDYTDAGRTDGLDSLKAAFSAAKREAKAKEKSKAKGKTK